MARIVIIRSDKYKQESPPGTAYIYKASKGGLRKAKVNRERPPSIHYSYVAPALHPLYRERRVDAGAGFDERLRYPPVILKRLEDVVVGPGANVILKCSIKGNPKPRVTWLHEKTQISHGIRHQYCYDEFGRGGEPTAELMIWGVTREDAGWYTCIAENDLGTKTASCCVQVTEYAQLDSPAGNLYTDHRFSRVPYQSIGLMQVPRY